MGGEALLELGPTIFGGTDKIIEVKTAPSKIEKLHKVTLLLCMHHNIKLVYTDTNSARWSWRISQVRLQISCYVGVNLIHPYIGCMGVWNDQYTWARWR